MRLNELSPGKGAKKVAKRVGRGHSAGQGKTSGSGQKGQKSRSGGFTQSGLRRRPDAVAASLAESGLSLAHGSNDTLNCVCTSLKFRLPMSSIWMY